MALIFPTKIFRSRPCNLATAGLFLTAFGLVMAFYGFPKIVKDQIKEKVALREGTEGYDMWKKMPFPLSFKVYLFNVTNPGEVRDGAKPKLREVGPYVYDEYREKDHIVVGDNDTISYYLKKTFYYNQNKSKSLKETDIITVLNVALLGMVITVNRIMPSMMVMINGVIPHLFNQPSDPFIRVTVADFLFNGVLINCTSGESMVGTVCEGLKSRLPPTIRESEEEGLGFYFSMFHHINNTLEGLYSVKTGVTEYERLGQITSFKNSTELDEWSGACSTIRGTDSTLFAPMDESNHPKLVWIFQPDVCRPMFAEFKAKKMAFSLPAYRYETTAAVLGSKVTHPENECYCPENWSSVVDGCSISGVQDLMLCQNTPVVASFPHFYLGDPSLHAYVEEGLHPSKEKHGTFVDIEPKTGAALRGAKRLQFNMELQKINGITILSSVQPGLFPIFWLDEGAEIDGQIKDLLNSVYMKIKIFKVMQWIIVVVGIVLMLASLHLRRQGSGEKWSWSPNRVDMVTAAPEDSRPPAVQKGRFFGFNNPAFSSNEFTVQK